MSEAIALPFTAASFNRLLDEHRLMAVRCSRCAALFLPPRGLCPTCRQDALAWVELSGHGALAAFTVIYVGPSALIAEGYTRENPYVTGIVALDEGPKISARILGLDVRHPEVSWIGTRLRVAYLDRGEGEARRTLLAFRAA